MPLVVNNTPFSSTCNSYASIVDMAEYVSTRVANAATAAAWAALTAEKKSLYLVNATRSIDSYAQWIGDRYSRDQRLDWPRINAYKDGYLIDQITFPIEVVEATYEMAIWMMLNSGEVSVDQSSSYDAIKVGPITIDFNQESLGSAKQYFPDIVAALLAGLGVVQNPELPGQRSIRVSRLQRT
jgi:hypothetical protein